MTRTLLLAAALLAPIPATAQQQPPPQQPQPRLIGEFNDWTAAALGTGAQQICYAFTRPQGNSEGAPPNRGLVMLTVTHRPEGRDQIALRAGYAYPRDSTVDVTVGATRFEFFTAGSDAFARDAAPVVAAFRRGATATAAGPGPQGRTGRVTDSFSLRGFTAAHEAINRECPPPRR
jgi:invasion protein IalB